MGERTSLGNRLRADLTDDLSVTVTAVGLALVAFVVVSLDGGFPSVSTDAGGGFLLAMSIMDTVFVYDDFWPVEYAPTGAVLWTLCLGSITAGIFIGVHQVALSGVGNTAASVVAFLTAIGAQFASALLYGHVRR